ncbi:hypothetical protein M3Y97_00329900 [Aphelenchoides bicaudatus]|nr:hypothetical protein M3Y97_00329900 [Aphelenchoides bicaudatus]
MFSVLSSMQAFCFVLLTAFFATGTAYQIPSPDFNMSQYTLDLTFGTDLILEPRLDLQKFLCKICDQAVEVAKVYVRNNQVKSGEQVIGFMTDQHYFDEFYDTCARKYEISWAKSGRFLACSTVLEPIVEQLKSKIQEQGANIAKEKKQICYKPGLNVCDEPPKHFWNILDQTSPVKKIQTFYQKHASMF